MTREIGEKMQIELQHGGKRYRADLDKPLDISIPLKEGSGTVNCFYAPLMEASPVVAGDFIGSTAKGGAVNFFNIRINPHGNGTHTECVGHIATGPYSINQCLTSFHFFARLISVYPQKIENGDRLIQKSQLKELIPEGELEAVIIRTLPNDEYKLKTNYSGSNPPYIQHEALAFLVEKGVKHLLIDLPSVDKEEDGGKLEGHRAFWQYPDNPRTDCTITELIYVPNAIADGFYLLNIQIAGFEIDVSPSKAVIFDLEAI